MPQPDHLLLNGKKLYYTEIKDQSFRETTVLDGYEEKLLEFCSRWLHGVQEYTVQTSGSTGVPKPITLTRQQMQASARLTGQTFGLTQSDRTLVCLNTDLIAGMMMLVRGFELGLQLIIRNPVANPLKDVADQEPFAFASFVPYQLHAMLQETPELLQELFEQSKAVLIGSGPVSAALENQLQELHIPFFATYGMTETCTHIAIRSLNGPDRTEEYQVLKGIKVATDNRGCLAIKGPVTNNEEIITNDLVELLDQTYFRLLGRHDYVINTGGVKVHPELLEPTIEQALARMGLSCRFFVTGLPHDTLGEEVTLVVELPGLEAAKAEALHEHLKQALRQYEVPKQILCRPVFQLTASGKLDQRATLASAQNQF